MPTQQQNRDGSWSEATPLRSSAITWPEFAWYTVAAVLLVGAGVLIGWAAWA